MRINNPQATKEKLLSATASLILERGTNNLTLENVAAAAKVSKGGLLHHFPNKQALLYGLVNQLGGIFKTRIENFLRLEPEQAGRFARAYIHASFEYAPDELRLTNAIAEIISQYPELVQELQLEFVELDQKMQTDQLPAARATVIRLACDGLWLNELLGLENFQAPRRQELLAELLEMTR